ncbi:MAG: T9SS type A sorting domain-containing protein [Saprospiraceae bacterium]|nr:T9SS type A sorting domain-containing protein [Saprospiraceae bacterium]
MKRLLAATTLLLVLVSAVNSQILQVYPGDITNNGIVNNLDFLQLGMAYNFAGPARDSGSLDFTPQNVEPWSYHFPSGQNMAYADCNGDGFVNYFYDAFPLYTNYGMERSTNVIPDVFPAGLPGVDPQLMFDHAAAPSQVTGGQMIRLPIVLGTIDNPVEDLYGLAFSVYIDPLIIDANNVLLDFNQNSFANPDNDRIWLYKKVSDEQIDVAWVRTDKNQKSGYGPIGYADFVIIVDIVAQQPQQYPIRIENIETMDKFGNYSPIAGDTLTLTVPADSNVSATNTPLINHSMSLFPNPTSDRVYIRSIEPIHRVALIDMLGQQIWSSSVSEKTEVETLLPKVPAGNYMLRVETSRGTLFKKLQIQQ